MTPQDRAARLVLDLGPARADEIRAVRPLTGGVASDICRVDLGDRQVCTKFALERLRVAQDWRVPVVRNRAEYAWLAFAAGVDPTCAPRVLGRSEALGGFAMEMIAGPDVFNWKERLMAGVGAAGAAAGVGRALARLHAASVIEGFDRAAFDKMDLFGAIRIAPYLETTASRLPVVAGPLMALAEGLRQRQTCLIHGDISPKNILLRSGAPVFLDAECATMGDPVFDVAFCLNHLMLKAVHFPDRAASLAAEAAALWRAYRDGVTWEDIALLEARAAALLPALMLCRVLGKSPVDYLSPEEQKTVLETALPLVHIPPATLQGVFARVAGRVGGTGP